MIVHRVKASYNIFVRRWSPPTDGIIVRGFMTLAVINLLIHIPQKLTVLGCRAVRIYEEYAVVYHTTMVDPAPLSLQPGKL